MLAYGMLYNLTFTLLIPCEIDDWHVYIYNILRIHIEVRGWLVFIDSSAYFTWLYPQLEWFMGGERWTKMVCWNSLYNSISCAFLFAIVFLINLHV
jgi:hypothetical protein